MTRDRVFARCNPRGFRPRPMGRIPNGGLTGSALEGKQTELAGLLRKKGVGN
jgi:hypothetical protein